MPRIVNLPEAIAEWDAPVVGTLTKGQLFTLLAILGVFVVGFGWLALFLHLSPNLTMAVMFAGVISAFAFTYLRFEGVPLTTYTLRKIVYRMRPRTYTDTRAFLSYSDLDGNMLVHVSSTRFIKLMEIRPVNFSFLRDEDQETLLATFETMLNTIDSEIHIFCTTERFNPDEYLGSYADIMRGMGRGDPRVGLIKDYTNFFKDITTKSNIMIRRYYIAVVGDSKRDAKELYREKDTEVKVLYKRMHDVLDRRLDTVLGILGSAGLEGYVLDAVDIQAVLKSVYGGVD